MMWKSRSLGDCGGLWIREGLVCCAFTWVLVELGLYEKKRYFQEFFNLFKMGFLWFF